jgi:hypothetical protein
MPPELAVLRPERGGAWHLPEKFGLAGVCGSRYPEPCVLGKASTHKMPCCRWLRLTQHRAVTLQFVQDRFIKDYDPVRRVFSPPAFSSHPPDSLGTLKAR